MGNNARAALVLAALAGPLILGLVAMPQLDWRFRGVPEMLSLASFGGFVVWAVAHPWSRARLRERGGFLGRHLTMTTVLCLVLGGGTLVGAAFDAADLFAAPTQATVQVEFARRHWRSAALTLHTTDGEYRTPFFWFPEVKPGPATLTLGRFSGRVLEVEQPPP